NCPSLKRFEIVSPVTLPPALTYPTLDGVTELRIIMTSPNLIHLLDTTHRTLRSLFISIPYTLENIDAVQPYTLPNLENLVVEIEVEKPTPEASSELDHALFRGESDSDFCKALVAFLDSKGQALLFLHLEGCSQEVLQQLLDRCPVLEHLRLHMTEHSEPVQKGLPRLHGMRVIDSLGQSYVDSIPQEFVMADNDAYKIEFPGISFRNKVGLIHVDFNTSLEGWRFRRADGHHLGFKYPEDSKESEHELSSNTSWESDEAESDASLGDLEIAGPHWQDQPVTDHNSDEEEPVQ
ncbi:hypothetical protein H0H92_008167, partial [Tricholoma furcatifolium]